MVKATTRNARGARKLGNPMRLAGTNARKTGELLKASGQVIAKRTTLGAAAMLDPLNADHAEFAKIIPEKTRAFSQAGLSWLQWSGTVAEQMTRFGLGEMASLGEAVLAIARCHTPAGVVATQSRFATAYLARALSQSIMLTSLATRSQHATMAPIHRTATANARRLSR